MFVKKITEKEKADFNNVIFCKRKKDGKVWTGKKGEIYTKIKSGEFVEIQKDEFEKVIKNIMNKR